MMGRGAPRYFIVTALFAGVACGGGDNGSGDAPDATADATTRDGGIDGTGPTDAPAEAPSDTRRDEPPPPRPPFDWVGIVGSGQSLSVGATAGNLSTTQPFGNLKLVDTGADPKYPIADGGAPKWATAPLTEPIRAAVAGAGPGYTDGQYPNSIAGETPHSGMANTLTSLFRARGGQGDYVTAHSVVGWSGHPLRDIDKAGGQRAYPASLHEAAVWKGLAGAAGKTFGYGGVVLTHGESDAANAAYGNGIFQLWQDYDTDLRAITGQTEPIVLLVSQQSSFVAGASGSAVQVWRAGVQHPGQIVCTGPKYAYEYSPDHVHFPAPGYERLGQKYAEVFDLVVNQKVAWKPLQPNKITRAGAVITVAFDVPNPPLVFDANVAPPHAQANTEWAAGKGFEVTDAGGAKLTIASATISGSNVLLTLSADPGAAKVNVAYAITQDGTGYQGGTNLGMYGLLRDSDEFTGDDAETIETQLTAGSAVAASTKAGAFTRRAGRDIVAGPGVPADTMVVSHVSDDALTLSAPWPGATGKVMLSFRHDHRNYCVHFAMDAQ